MMRIFASIFTLLAFLLLEVQFPALCAGDYPVEPYGAMGDGKTLNTEFIQAAIDACALAGGGRVVMDSGVFLSGALIMKSHVDLLIMEAATLLGSTDPGHYPEMSTPYRFYGDDWVKQSLIFGDRLEEKVPELEKLYPEATKFGTLPASVFYLRHIERIQILKQ